MKTYIKGNTMKVSIRTVVLACLLVSLSALSAFAQEKVYENAPKIGPETTSAMHTAEFWISQLPTDPDKVILTPEQISAKNNDTVNIPEKLKTAVDINGDPYDINKTIGYNDKTGAQYAVIDPLEMLSFPGDSLRARLATHRKHVNSRDFYDHRDMIYDEDKKNEWFAMTDVDAIPDVITPRYGIVTAHSSCRVIPTNQAGLGKKGQWWVEGFQSASVDLAIPVTILHETKDKDWYYVRTEVAFGWIPAKDVAIGSKKEIAKYAASKDFIVSLANKVPVYGDKKYGHYMLDLYMGATLKLVKKTSDGYRVKAPFRKSDGNLTLVNGYINSDANVSIGFQPFTQRNMYTTLFELLYTPYHWNDANNGRNCCGYIRSVLRTFGIKTGSWPSFQMHYANKPFVFPADTPREKKHELLRRCAPGVCLVGGNGHVNAYLGEVDGFHYLIHMGGYDWYEGDNKVMMYRRVNVNYSELPGNYNIDSWTKISPLVP